MPFATDAHFVIGGMHVRGNKPCQDYATAGVLDTAAYAIVSDGCSSGGHTDNGARLVTLTTARAIQEHLTMHGTVDEIDPQHLLSARDVLLSGFREQLMLKKEDLLATCLHAVVDATGGYVHVHGDGAFVLKYADGTMDLYVLEWAKNMPFYPVYTGEQRQRFIQEQAESETPLTVKKFFFDVDGNVYKEEEGLPIDDALQGYALFFELENEEGSPLTHVALLSDGVEQLDPHDTITAAKNVTAFKGSGEFVKRWLNKAIKDSLKVGKGPQDDIACAAIHILPIPEQEDA